MKKNYVLGFSFFVGDISGVDLVPGPQPQEGSILLKLLVETRLKSESFGLWRFSMVSGLKVGQNKQSLGKII